MNSILHRYLITLFSFALAISVTTKAVATSTSNRHATKLIDRAKQLYIKEQYSTASQIWQQAVKAFQQQKDILNQAMALSNLALTQQKLGDLTAAEEAIASSLELLQARPQTEAQQRILANSLDIKGSVARSRGQSQLALETWQQAAAIYQELDSGERLIKNNINQAQALQDLGYYRRASKVLSSVQTKLSNQPNSLAKVAALLSFGNTLRVTGNLELSLGVLKEAAKIATELNAAQQNAVLLSLGNTIQAIGNQSDRTATIQQADMSAFGCLDDNNLATASAYYLQATDCYQQAALARDLETKTKAQLNLLGLIVGNRDKMPPQPPKPGGRMFDSSSSPQTGGDYREAKDVANPQQTILDLIADIKANLTDLPVTRSTIYDRLNLVQSLICLQPNTLEISSPIAQSCQPPPENSITSWKEIEAEINLALQQAQQLEDQPAQTYAWGYLGAVYQQTGRLSQARQSTEQALLAIDNNAVPEIAYLWQWQLGRIARLQNQPKAAIQSYNAAFTTLQSVRTNLVAINPELQFAFRDRIEPLYRERAALLLNNNPSQENLRQARDTIEALQLAELNNFFREACLDATPQEIEQIDPNAAVIYSIILPDRLAVILSQSGKPLEYHQTNVKSQEIDRVFEDLYANLNPFLATTQKPQQTFYNWLIRPLESQLKNSNTKILVFILDGVMRGIPVAALYDGKQYLVEKYSLALTPGLQLLASSSLTDRTIETIAAGLTEARQGFSALPNVREEVSEIATLVPSEVLLDRDFTRDRLRGQVTSLSYPVVHLATHGQFASRAEDTFLLTWSDRINVRDLDELLQDRDLGAATPIELLILSACQTATGDKQAALGLAGVAVRSGARSTLATLWSIQDDSTAKLMTEFYRAIQTPGISKAEALRQAQLSLLQNPKYQHPFYWSAFVLVGNWL